MTSVRQEQAAEDAEEAPETIEALFGALESPLLSYAMRFLKERPLAEDVVQEAFMKLHAHFAEVQAPRRWLYRTVHNLALNQLRAGKKIVPMTPPVEGEEPQMPDPEPLPDEQIVRWEGIGLVRLSLGALDARSRELIRLKFNEDLSYRQIAERTGISVSNVGYILHHALKTMAAELARTGLVP